VNLKTVEGGEIIALFPRTHISINLITCFRGLYNFLESNIIYWQAHYRIR